MKTRLAIPFSALLAGSLLLYSCSSSAGTRTDSSVQSESASLPASETSAVLNVSSTDTTDSKTVVVFFTAPTDHDGTDTDTSASVVVEEGKQMGNSEYVATLIAEQLGTVRAQIETAEAYPSSYDELLEIGKKQKDEDTLPELKNVPDLKGYDRVILVSPIWYAAAPAPVRSFLENTDWTGKEADLVVISGGSGLSALPNEVE